MRICILAILTLLFMGNFAFANIYEFECGKISENSKDQKDVRDKFAKLLESYSSKSNKYGDEKVNDQSKKLEAFNKSFDKAIASGVDLNFSCEYRADRSYVKETVQLPLLAVAISNIEMAPIMSEVINKFLENGADPNVRDADGKNAVFYAVASKQEVILDKLLERNGIDLSAEDIYSSPLYFALKTQNISPSIALKLIAAGANTSQKTESGNSLLSIYLQKKNYGSEIDAQPEVVKALLAQGNIDVNSLNDYSQTALSIYLVDPMASAEIVNILFENGAVLKAEDQKQSALMGLYEVQGENYEDLARSKEALSILISNIRQESDYMGTIPAHTVTIHRTRSCRGNGCDGRGSKTEVEEEYVPAKNWDLLKDLTIAYNVSSRRRCDSFDAVSCKEANAQSENLRGIIKLFEEKVDSLKNQ